MPVIVGHYLDHQIWRRPELVSTVHIWRLWWSYWGVI